MAIDQKELHDFEKWIKDNISEDAYKNVVEKWIKGIYEGYNHANPPPDMVEMRLLTKLHKRWKEGRNAIWITLSPDHLKNPLKYHSIKLDQLSNFCLKWFNEKRYSYYSWVIEVGKNKEDPHLHVHALVQLKHKSMAKNHARDLKTYWERKLSHTLKGKDYYSQTVTGIYRDDKLEYMTNSAKGSHENYIENPFDDERMKRCRNSTFHKTAGELS